MSPHIPDFGAVRVAVAGDVMIDHYWYGQTARISPEAPVPVVAVNGREQRAGGAANVACNAASLGARATLCGVTGDDDQGRALSALCAEAGVRDAMRSLHDYATIAKTRIISRQQQLLRLDHEAPVPPHGAQVLLESVRGALPDCDILVLSDYGKGALADVQAIIRAARDVGRPVLVDPKGEDFERYRGATLLTPNQAEFEAVVGRSKDDEELVDRARSLREQLRLDALLVTRGEHGMTLVPASGRALHLRAEAREVFDVTGAGDTVIATLACALGAGTSAEVAAHLANVAAGVAVSRFGAAVISRADLIDGATSAAQPARGLLSRDALVEELAAARARGERIVMTNGCFDILHAGHVHYLAAAAALGDRLIVALNDDASVARLKGASRPLNSQVARAAVLGALAAVDWVVFFEDDTPAALIDALAPDVLVKGGDYRIEEIAGADGVLARGGEVRVIDFVPGYSTTDLLERARR